MIREELARLFTFGERHRRLLARLLLAFGLSIVVFLAGTVLIWVSESGQKGGSIHGFGDAAFFCSVQLLTVSSSMTNPLTLVGKVVDAREELRVQCRDIAENSGSRGVRIGAGVFRIDHRMVDVDLRPIGVIAGRGAVDRGDCRKNAAGIGQSGLSGGGAVAELPA